MRTEQNINTERFESIDQSYQQFVGVDLAKITVSVAKKAAKENKGLSAKVPGRRFIEKIPWKDVDMDNDQFILQLYPVSKLPNDPEGRLQTITDMAEAGWIEPATARRLLDFPDLDAEENLANSQLDYLHMVLDKIIEEGVFTAPDPFDNLQQAKKLALEYYSQGKLNLLDEEKLEQLRLFMQQIDNLLQQAMPPPVPQAGPAPANPTPTPISQLLPNTNSNLGAA